jgi:hypothetical protein
LNFALVPKQKNQTLQELYLSYNQIGDVGAAALGEGIAVSDVARGCWLFFVVGYLASLLSVTQLDFCSCAQTEQLHAPEAEP